jgi:hypothetical protein
MSAGRIEKRGGSEKRGTSIASKKGETRGALAAVTRAPGQSGRPTLGHASVSDAHGRWNQLSPSIVARVDKNARTGSSDDGIDFGKLSGTPAGSKKLVDRFQIRNVRLVEVNDQPQAPR